jgi:hypothetical protein
MNPIPLHPIPIDLSSCVQKTVSNTHRFYSIQPLHLSGMIRTQMGSTKDQKMVAVAYDAL